MFICCYWLFSFTEFKHCFCCLQSFCCCLLFFYSLLLLTVYSSFTVFPAVNVVVLFFQSFVAVYSSFTAFRVHISLLKSVVS